MRIGIDYTAAVRQGAGIGRYARNLVRALADLDDRSEYTLFVAGGWGEGDGLGPWPANFRIRSVPLSDRWLQILWQRLRLPVPIQTVTGPLDLFHSPDFVLPPTAGTPAVLTVHDLSFLRVPECYVPAFRRYLETAVSRAVARAERILADSESTRRDLIALMDVDPDRVIRIYPGVESRFQPILDPETLSRTRQRYHLPDRFILGLGTLQPRKNYSGLLEAFHQLLNTATDDTSQAAIDDSELHLVIVGGKGWLYDDFLRQMHEAGLEGRVHLTGFVQDVDLPAIYNLALAFAFPTWYEGFGLPVLEAMACGTPVVAADNSSLPEVVGRAGLLVDAADPQAMASALARLLSDGDLRGNLVAAGLEQAKQFRWDTAARMLLGVYERLER